MNSLFKSLFLLGFVLLGSISAFAQEAPASLDQINQRLIQVERQLTPIGSVGRKPSNELTHTGGVAILFAAFCALWAQNSGRSAWLWFFLGLLFSVLTVIVLLSKNASDRFDKQQRDRFRNGRP